MAPDWQAPPSPGLVVTTARVASAATHAGWQGRGIAPDLPVPTLAPAWSPLPLPWGTLARALADPPGSARGPGVLPQARLGGERAAAERERAVMDLRTLSARLAVLS